MKSADITWTSEAWPLYGARKARESTYLVYPLLSLVSMALYLRGRPIKAASLFIGQASLLAAGTAYHQLTGREFVKNLHAEYAANLSLLQTEMDETDADWEAIGRHLLHATTNEHLSLVNHTITLIWAAAPLAIYPDSSEDTLRISTRLALENHNPGTIALLKQQWLDELALLTPLFAEQPNLETDWNAVAKSVALLGTLTLLLAAIVFTREVYTRGIRLWPKTPIYFPIHSPSLFLHTALS